MSQTRHRYAHLLVLTVATVAFACDSGGGGGCGGCGDGCGGTGGAPYVFQGTPEEHVVFQAGQVHVTQSGLDRISTNIEPLIAGALGSDAGLSFCLPPTDLGGVATLCGGSARCGGGEPGCQLDVELRSVGIVPTRTADPSSDQIRVNAVIALDETLPTSLLGCGLFLRSADAGTPVSLSAYMNVAGPVWERTSISLPSEEVTIGLDQLSFGVNGGFVCGILNGIIGLARGLIVGLIEDQISGALDGALGTALCQTCETSAQCPADAMCDADGVCMRGDACVPIPLGVETEVNIGELLADFAPGLDARLGVLAYAASYADAMGPVGSEFTPHGIDLGLQVGFYAEANACVPYSPPPSNDRVAKSSAIAADLTPGGDDFAIGIGFARSALNLALWSVYRAGTLCLSIGSDTIEQISSGTFGILLPSLGALTEGANRPMYLQLRPQEAPTIDLGEGTFTDSGEILDPLLQLNLRNLDIDFYVFAEDRYVRVMELNTDVEVPLALDANAEGQIVVLLGDLGAALTRLEVQEANLLSEADAGRVATVLPTLIGTLLPALAGDLIPPIDLPELIEGVRIVIPPRGITSVDDRQMLAIYADLQIGAAKSTPVSVSVDSVRVDRASREALDAMFSDVRARGADIDMDMLIPTVHLALQTTSGDEAEYSYRLNGGAWSTWRRGTDELVIRDVAMALTGRYVIDVQAREVGDPSTTSIGYGRAEVTIDDVPPTVSVTRDGLAALLVTDDAHSAEALQVRARVNYGDWQSLPPGEAVVDLRGAAGGNAHVEVEAQDGHGNVTTVTRTFNVESAATATEPASSSSSATDPARTGCTSAPTRGGWGWAAVLLGVLALRRRAAAAVAVVAAATALGGCNDKKSDTVDVEGCKPECTDGQVCRENECVSVPCATDEECDAPETCVEGVCVAPEPDPCDACTDTEVCVEGACVPAERPCETDDDCGEGQLCEDGECVSGECRTADDCTTCAADQLASCTEGRCSCGEPCPEGCAEGTACCNATGECLTVPTTCGAGTCDPGYRYEIVGDASWDPAACAGEVECDCVELPALALGNIGRYLDIATSADGSGRVVAAYNQTYGDFMIGEIAEDDSIVWTFVDGVPADGAVTGSPNGPRGGVAAAGPDVGLYPSVEFDSDGNLHAAYFARTGTNENHLIYAHGTRGSTGGYSWTTVVADPLPGAGYYTDIVVQSDGRPLIAYAVPALRGDDGVYRSAVRVAQPDTATPTATEAFGNFTLAQVDLNVACGGTCAGRERCRLDLNECAVPARASSCEDCAGGECFENIDGTFVCSEIGQALPGLPVLYYGTGVFLDAELLPSGEVAVAWYDHVGGNLMFVQANTGNFTPADAVVLDGQADGPLGPVDTGDTGWYPDLFVASDASVWISYADHGLGALRVLEMATMVSTAVDEGVQCFEHDEESGGCLAPFVSRVGYDSAFAESATGVFLVYQDASFHSIIEASLGEFGWTRDRTVAEGGDPYTGAYGFYTGHGTGTKGRYIVTQRLNQRTTPPSREVVVIGR